MSKRDAIGAEITAELVAKTKLERALMSAVPYLRPGITRGPANDDWVKTMKLVADALGWPTCEECGGAGEIVKLGRHVDVITGAINKNPQPRTVICTACWSVGKCDPEDL